MASLAAPISSSKAACASGVRAVIIAPTRELAHQIHNECLKLAQGRKWRIILFSKATASSLASKDVRDKVGGFARFLHKRVPPISPTTLDIIVSTPLRLVAALQSGSLELHK
jgi:ATP-dependent RNA helicase DDX52/ROK1